MTFKVKELIWREWFIDIKVLEQVNTFVGEPPTQHDHIEKAALTLLSVLAVTK
jgi:hypothetical protein